MSIRVVIADDHALVRAGFRALIEAEPGLEVVGEAADGAEAIELARTARPDVILMDIRMPGTDGVAELFITLATVKTHMSRLLTKLGARDRAQLIVTAYESGFVTRLAPHFVGVTVGFGLSVALGFGDEETVGLGEGAAPDAGALRHR